MPMSETIERELAHRQMSMERQQRKAIKILDSGNVHLIGEHDAEVSEEERTRVTEQLRTGALDGKVTKLLGIIEAPFSGNNDPKAVYNEVHEQPQLSRQLDDLLYEEVMRNAVRIEGGHAPETEFIAFLSEYPTPDVLERHFEATIERNRKEMEELQRTNPSSERIRMLKAAISLRRQRMEKMKPLLGKIYGKRAEYWDSIKALK